jgi:hypothetical protein
MHTRLFHANWQGRNHTIAQFMPKPRFLKYSDCIGFPSKSIQLKCSRRLATNPTTFLRNATLFSASSETSPCRGNFARRGRHASNIAAHVLRRILLGLPNAPNHLVRAFIHWLGLPAEERIVILTWTKWGCFRDLNGLFPRLRSPWSRDHMMC